MKLQGTVVLALALVACLASHAQAVFGDGPLTARHQEKRHSLSKRSLFQLFSFIPFLRHQFSRSSSDANSTTETTTQSTLETHHGNGIKSDFARMLTLTRQRRALRAVHKGQRDRRSLHELPSVEGFLKAKQDIITDALRTLPGGIFTGHQRHPVQGGLPLPGLGNIFSPFGLQPGQNTILFLHHDPQTTTNQMEENNATTTNGPEEPTSSIIPPAVTIVESAAPPVVGSAGSTVATPVIIVVQQPGGNLTSQGLSQTDQTTAMPPAGTQSVESRGVTPPLPVKDESSSSSAPFGTSTVLPSETSATTETTPASTLLTTQASDSSTPAVITPEKGGSETSQASEATTLSSSSEGTSAGQQESTTAEGSDVEGTATSQLPQEHAREDGVNQFLSDNS